MSAMDMAVATIKIEHRAPGAVMGALRRLLAAVAVRHAEPDFTLFSAVLCYIDDFPERCHHPEEDEHLFKTLRLRTTQFNALLDELQAEHIHSARMMARLHCVLVHYQGDAARGLENFHAAVDAYSAMLSEHMRKEEDCLNGYATG